MTEKEMLESVYRKAIEAVAPDSAVLNHVKVKDGQIVVGEKTYIIPEEGVYVAGAGKGAAPMGQALEKLLGDRIKDGFIVVKYGHALPLKYIAAGEAAHPIPDESSIKAAQRIIETASLAKSGGLLICLFTGGASSLLGEPAAPVTLEEWIETTRLLLACGADIKEINAIRRKFTRLGGGKLALQAYGAPVLTLLVSDVPGDAPEDIASGPTVNDLTPHSRSLEIFKKYALVDKVPASVRKIAEELAHEDEIIMPSWDEDLDFADDFSDDDDDDEFSILFDDEDDIPEDLFPGLPEVVFEMVDNIVIASNWQALQAAAKQARLLGLEPVMEKEQMTGEAREVAARLITKAKEIQKGLAGKSVCLLAGGETTVTLKGSGKGGRNQEMVLAAAIELYGSEGIAALFSGTDGTDGPTDAAGGFAFGNTADKIGGVKLAKKLLADNDSFMALKKADDLFITGPTLTNVMDLAIIIINPLK